MAGFLRVMILSLLTATFALTTLHAQTVAYVANAGSNAVSVIDTASNTVTATIPVGKAPAGVAISHDGSRAYITNEGDDTVSVIDTDSNTVIATITLGGTNPFNPAVTPDGKSLYVPDITNGVVHVVSTATNTVVATISAFPFAATVIITPDGTRAYVLGLGQVMEAIDTASNTVIAIIPVPSAEAIGLAVSPTGTFVYAVGGEFPEVSVIATSTNTVASTIPLPADSSYAMVLSPDGSTGYVTNFRSNAVNLIDTATNTLEATTIPVGRQPLGIAVTPDGGFVYVSNNIDGTVSVIDTATNTVVTTVAVGVWPEAIAIANLSTPFAAFTIGDLNVSPQGFSEQGNFTLGAASPGIDLAHQPVTLTLGGFSVTIPAGSFREVGGNLHFVLNSTTNGSHVNCNLKADHGSSTSFQYACSVNGVDLTGQNNPVTVGLKIGHNAGTTTVEF